MVETHLNIDGYPVIVSDTAGIRESKDEIEKRGIRLALKRADEADLNLVIIEPKSVDFTGFLNDLVNEKAIVVLNKSDLVIKNINANINKFNPIIISLKDEKNTLVASLHYSTEYLAQSDTIKQMELEQPKNIISNNFKNWLYITSTGLTAIGILNSFNDNIDHKTTIGLGILIFTFICYFNKNHSKYPN